MKPPASALSSLPYSLFFFVFFFYHSFILHCSCGAVSPLFPENDCFAYLPPVTKTSFKYSLTLKHLNLPRGRITGLRGINTMALYCLQCFIDQDRQSSYCSLCNVTFYFILFCRKASLRPVYESEWEEGLKYHLFARFKNFGVSTCIHGLYDKLQFASII